MFIERGENGNIIGAYSMRQEFPVEEISDDDPELITFLERKEQ